MSGLLANLVGAATAALNLRSQDAPARAPKDGAEEGRFASALSAALTPRQRAEEARQLKAADAAADAAQTARDGAEEDAATAAGASESDRARQLAGSADAAAEAKVDAATAGMEKAATAEKADSAEKADEANAALAVGAAEGPGPARRSPTEVSRSVEGLNPEFRARLDRVIERMEKEHGHEVRIVETVRDQARQNFLYEQGRSRPGPVVTWTRSSNHSEGRAADLMVDGTYDNPLAMVRLARIAREEGLRTLGSRDPGHVELPAGVRVERMAVAAEGTSTLLDQGVARASEAARTATIQPASVNGVPGMARVAQVARVATVAQVAQVATVARVATPGSVGAASFEAPAAPQFAPEVAAPVAGQMASTTGESSSEGRGREGESSSREQVAEAAAEATPRTATGASLAMEARSGSAAAGEVRGAQPSFGADAAERIARVLQLQDTAPSRPLSQMILRLDNAVGGEDRIRVDLRGSSVGASLNVSDPVAAARLQSELGQLQRALEGRGLQAEHLSVTGALAGRELAEAIRTAVPTDSGQRASHDPQSQREGWTGRSGGRQNDGDSEQPRQRPRKDSQQERNT